MLQQPVFYSEQPVDITVWKAYFAQHETDVKVFEFIQDLRNRTESLSLWLQTKEKAREELASIPADIVEQLFTRFESFISHLPTGHGRGHFTRDLVHLMTIFQDPEIQKYDVVELFVGLVAGDFHDIGNSVVERYDDPKNFAAHADVGAFLFGEVAKDLIPPHLLSLILMCIAAHTHYLKDIEIVKQVDGHEEKRIRSPFDDVVDEKGNKFAMWLTQMSDRLDAQGVVFVARVILTKAEPTVDYLDGKFYVTHDDESKDFKHQFAPILRNQSYKQQLPTAFDQTANVLEHVRRFCESPLTDTPYSKQDSYFYINSLMTPPALEAFQFILKVISKSAVMVEEKRYEAFERFFRLCQIIDPAPDMDHVLSLLRKKFKSLTEEEQSQWAYGFEVLVDELYPRYYKRMEKLLEHAPTMHDEKLQEIIHNAHILAQKKLKQFAPPQS